MNACIHLREQIEGKHWQVYLEHSKARSLAYQIFFGAPTLPRLSSIREAQKCKTQSKAQLYLSPAITQYEVQTMTSHLKWLFYNFPKAFPLPLSGMSMQLPVKETILTKRANSSTRKLQSPERRKSEFSQNPKNHVMSGCL